MDTTYTVTISVTHALGVWTFHMEGLPIENVNEIQSLLKNSYDLNYLQLHNGVNANSYTIFPASVIRESVIDVSIIEEETGNPEKIKD